MLIKSQFIFCRTFTTRRLDFSPRATRLSRQLLKSPVRLKSRQKSSWSQRSFQRAVSPRENWLRKHLPQEPLEGGVQTSLKGNILVTRRANIRGVKRLIAVNSFLQTKKVLETSTQSDLAFSRPLQQTGLFLHQYRVALGARLQKKLKDSLFKKNSRLPTVLRRRQRTSSLRATPLGFLRRKMNKLSGIWFLRRRRRIRRKFRALLSAKGRSSRFGVWFNTTKLFSDLRSVVTKSRSEHARRAVQLSKKNIPYVERVSGLFAPLARFGRLDYAQYGQAFQSYNNISHTRALSDYFAFAHMSSYLPATVIYPADRFNTPKSSAAALDCGDFDLTLFESRSAFWESYINTPTSKSSWLKTRFKTVASKVLVQPLYYKQTFSTFLSKFNVNSNKKALSGFTQVSMYSLRKRYFRKSWQAILRIKFERFIFNRVRFPVYVWFHNIWGLFFKGFYRWRRFEFKVISKFVSARRRNKSRGLKLRVNWFKMLIRSLALLGSIVGGVHCFTYVFSFLMIKFRKHWQVLKLIKRYLRRCVRVHKTITGIRVAISGRFTGHMRARKSIFKIGGKIRYMNYLRRLTYVLFNSQSPWGVFGIRMWIQFKPKRVRFIDTDMDKILKKSHAVNGLLSRKSLLRYSRQTLVDLDNRGFSLKYYTNDDIEKKRHVNDLYVNYAIKGTQIT